MWFQSIFSNFNAQTGELIKNSTPVLINNMTPEEVQPPSSQITNAVKIAKTKTNEAADFSENIALRVASASSKLGQFLAPHVKHQGTRLLQNTLNMSDSEASNAVDGIVNVASNAFHEVSTTCNGLESSASILGENIKTSSVKIVEHKYGSEYGELTNDALTTVGNIYLIRRNMNLLLASFKGIVQNSGKAVIEEMKTKSS